MQKGDILNAMVIGLGNSGDPVLKSGNHKLFLKNPQKDRIKDIGTKKIKELKLNEFIKVRVVKLFDKFSYAELVS